MTERERLIQEVICIVIKNPPGRLCMEAIAEFILAERRRICAPLLRNYPIPVSLIEGLDMAIEAVNETLKLAGLEDGNG